MTRKYATVPWKFKLTTEKERTCLGILPDGTYCNAKFVSPHPGIRFCPSCSLNHTYEMKSCAPVPSPRGKQPSI